MKGKEGKEGGGGRGRERRGGRGRERRERKEGRGGREGKVGFTSAILAMWQVLNSSRVYVVPGSMAAMRSVSMLTTHWLCTSSRAGRSLGCRMNRFFSNAFLQAAIFLRQVHVGRGVREQGEGMRADNTMQFIRRHLGRTSNERSSSIDRTLSTA